ncbi:SEC-C domain-containing protein [Vibrio aestuarianus]|uniref:SEC-C metal-binding domain-containing protein n=1 Tax=Vibrio aestuarianus TaxID=28171 RepID=UPI00237CDE07|nr:SEC-C metal-binding domain-containing protein [Vibrio aestuarianus]MDE1351832.1 SEC-C domain-containing protein [Vibrio aestuarianus]
MNESQAHELKSANLKAIEFDEIQDDITDEQLEELVCLITKKRNRNKPCICRSGKKLKHCCLSKITILKQQHANELKGAK